MCRRGGIQREKRSSVGRKGLEKIRSTSVRLSGKDASQPMLQLLPSLHCDSNLSPLLRNERGTNANALAPIIHICINNEPFLFYRKVHFTRRVWDEFKHSASEGKKTFSTDKERGRHSKLLVWILLWQGQRQREKNQSDDKDLACMRRNCWNQRFWGKFNYKVERWIDFWKRHYKQRWA